MGRLSVNFELNYQSATPKEWQDIEIIATFDDQAQPVLITDEFTFVNEDAQRVLAWFAEHPFEGMPFGMLLDNGDDSHFISGCLDFSDFTVLNIYEVRCKIKVDDGLDLLDERVKGVTYGYLAREDGGIISKEDYTIVPVVIRKKFDAVEVAMTSVSLFLISREISSFFNEGKKSIVDIAIVGIEDPLSKPAAAFKVIATKILMLAYYAIILIAVYRMIRSIFENLYPIKTKYKGMTERKLLEKACEHFNLTLDCDIPEIDWTIYLPSKTDNKIRKNRKDEGIPNVSDFGYNVSEFFELIMRKYNAKPKKIGNKLYIRTEDSQFWFETSTYILPDILFDGSTVAQTAFRYNTEDMKANRLISFLYDPTDEWTMPNARKTPFDSKEIDFELRQHDKGVAFEVITDLSAVTDQRYKLNKGLEEVRIPQALAARKTTLSALEQSGKVLFAAVDLVIKLFGGKTFGQKIEEARGSLLISADSFSICKSLVLQNGIIPANQRTLLSAERLYNQYHTNKSFVTNPTRAQRKVYDSVKIPFTFTDFKTCIDNSYFTTSDGRQGKFTSLKYRIDGDYAIANFWIADEYVKPGTLTETKIST